MSKYVTYNIRAFRSLEVLLAALATMGYSADKVEVHEQPQTLYGIGSEARAERANVIIRRHNTGAGASNDVGFLREADGTYRVIISEYDTAALRFDAQAQLDHTYSGATFTDTLRKQYGSINGDRTIRTLLTKTIPDMKRRGIIPKTAIATTQQVNGGRQVVVSYDQ